MPSVLEIKILELKRQLRGYEDQVRTNTLQVEKWEDFVAVHAVAVKEKNNSLAVYRKRKERYENYAKVLRAEILQLQQRLNGTTKEAPAGPGVSPGKADSPGDMATPEVVGETRETPSAGGGGGA